MNPIFGMVHAIAISKREGSDVAEDGKEAFL
jgi:hypothetical protein